MRIVIASDIHGAADCCKKLLDVYCRKQGQLLVLLGDILYHGPRNDLPTDYAPKTVIDLLNGMADQIQCVRGNCDAEVDQMVLHFPILQPTAYTAFGAQTGLITHGHRCGETQPEEETCPLLLCGHTHVPKVWEYPGYLYLNPGSVGIPKADSPHSCMVYEDGVFSWLDLETGVPFMTCPLPPDRNRGI